MSKKKGDTSGTYKIHGKSMNLLCASGAVFIIMRFYVPNKSQFPNLNSTFRALVGFPFLVPIQRYLLV